MRIVPISRRRVSSSLFALGALASTGCVTKSNLTDGNSQARSPGTAPSSVAATATVAPASPPAASSPLAAKLPPIMSFDEAVANAGRAVLAAAPLPDGIAVVVIDPLVDGVTGYQSTATRSIQDSITGIAKKDFPRYAVQRITPESLKLQPRVLVGTFTPVNAQMKPAGERDAYRFCLVMGDLKTGKIIAKAVVRSRLDDADATPTAAFGDSPVWSDDPSHQVYIATCQGSDVGDPIKPEYFGGLLAAAVLSEAADAYDEQRYSEALNLYRLAGKTPAGDQLRVYNGIYLCLTKLRRTSAASAAFGDLVDYGLRKKRLAVKFLFRPGSVRLVADNDLSAGYSMWLQQIASKAALGKACFEITGHASPAGPAPMNDRLSLLRAEYIQSQLEDDEPSLKKRTVAVGAGSRENLIGTGRDDATDVLDRRVELKPIEPCA
jgi:hypothetical protein